MSRRTRAWPLGLLLFACGNPVAPAPGAGPAAPSATGDTDPPGAGARAATPPFTVGGDGEGLLMTWFDGEGLHIAQRRADIPDDRRAQVRVVSLRADPAHRPPPEQVFVADLRTPGDDGRYPITQMPRATFDALVDGAVEAAAPAEAEVVLYSASWCGVCKQARRFFQERGVAFTEKDIEKDRAAAAELGRKASAAGKQPRGVPVIDFGGELIMGFDRARLSALIAGD